ncbi:MAG: DUF4189 domain-containing protein [Oscillatoriaceae cyanobacterium Prado104]|jgi:hypothetical protein|nr:DUF4189 domain-containing protein [Oscillatoriaceae cyanobacterium Prado104]
MEPKYKITAVYLEKFTHNLTRSSKLFTVSLSTIGLVAGCSLLDFSSGVEVKVTDIPVGQSELTSGKMMAFTESKSIKNQSFDRAQFNNTIYTANAIQNQIKFSIDKNRPLSGRRVGRYQSGSLLDRAFTLRFTSFNQTSGNIAGEITEPNMKMYFQGKVVGTQLNFTITQSVTGGWQSDMFPDNIKGTFFNLRYMSNSRVMKGKFKHNHSLKSIEGDVYLILPYSSTTRSTEKWGAIASGSGSQDLGWSWGSPTREESEIVALESCQKRFGSCKSLVAFNNCAAYAGGEPYASANSAGAWATSNSLDAARKRALQICERQGICKIITAFCSDGRGAN